MFIVTEPAKVWQPRVLGMFESVIADYTAWYNIAMYNTICSLKHLYKCGIKGTI